MRDHREFKVYPIGFEERDLQVLKRILKISAGSARSYILTEEGLPEAGKILLVNADSPAALSEWRYNHVPVGGGQAAPVIFASRAESPDTNGHRVTLPFRATLLLGILDAITVEELNYIPELTIGAEDSDDEMAINEQRLTQIVNQTVGERPAQYKAMVVDDSLPVRKQLELELRMLGAEVQLAENGEQAMELSRDARFDIIFLDVMMPGIDGYKVCKALKKDARTRNTPVIMLTGKSSPFDKVKGTLAGCDTYLTKPLQHADFQSVARKYLQVVQ